MLCPPAAVPMSNAHIYAHPSRSVFTRRDALRQIAPMDATPRLPSTIVSLPAEQHRIDETHRYLILERMGQRMTPLQIPSDLCRNRETIARDAKRNAGPPSHLQRSSHPHADPRQSIVTVPESHSGRQTLQYTNSLQTSSHVQKKHFFDIIIASSIDLRSHI